MIPLFSWILISLAFNNPKTNDSISNEIKGAWMRSIETEHGSATISKTYTKSYFIYAIYTGDVFLEAGGGTWEIKGDLLVESYEFNTSNPGLVGKSQIYRPKIEDNILKINGNINIEWIRVDNGKSDLAGVWRISARKQEGMLVEIQSDSRKTFKVLSGTRFQWAAYDIDSKTFFGTGGGVFEIKDDKYTEKIEFFSRDDSKIGSILEFDFELKENKWHHSGFSSKNEPIFEIWTSQD